MANNGNNAWQALGEPCTLKFTTLRSRLHVLEMAMERIAAECDKDSQIDYDIYLFAEECLDYWKELEVELQERLSAIKVLPDVPEAA